MRLLVSTFSVQSSLSHIILSGLIVFSLANLYKVYRMKEDCCSETCPDPQTVEICSPPVTAWNLTVNLPSSWPEKQLNHVEAIWQGRLEKGGVFRPTHCFPATRIAILIPYRNRSSHLANFLEIMHPFLQRQNIQYVIVAIHQIGDAPFLRGLLFNAGFLESIAHLSFRPDCFILHDVDHIPERQGMFYQCSSHGVTHLSHAIDRFDYNLFMPEFTGGVSGVTRKQYELVNGFSNFYIGWGCEDEDFYVRITKQNLKLVRAPAEIARYSTLPHVPNYPNWFWDQFISRLDRERFSNLKEIVDTDGKSSERYDYNKYLQAVALERAGEEGLHNARLYYKLEGVVYHASYTELRISPDLNKIKEDGIAFLTKMEDVLDALH